jgi:hypothetical protein
VAEQPQLKGLDGLYQWFDLKLISDKEQHPLFWVEIQKAALSLGKQSSLENASAVA